MPATALFSSRPSASFPAGTLHHRARTPVLSPEVPAPGRPRLMSMDFRYTCRVCMFAPALSLFRSAELSRFQFLNRAPCASPQAQSRLEKIVARVEFSLLLSSVRRQRWKSIAIGVCNQRRRFALWDTRRPENCKKRQSANRTLAQAAHQITSRRVNYFLGGLAVLCQGSKLLLVRQQTSWCSRDFYFTFALQFQSHL